MRLFIAIILLLPIYCQAQTILPNWLIDSMSYEVRLGRQCRIALDSQTVTLQRQGQELMETGTALKLSQGENKTLENLLQNQKDSNLLDRREFEVDLNHEKKKVKKWRRIAVGEALGIIGTLILIL